MLFCASCKFCQAVASACTLYNDEGGRRGFASVCQHCSACDWLSSKFSRSYVQRSNPVVELSKHSAPCKDMH